MLRPFGETTLTDIVLAKLAHANYFTFFAGYEDEFRNKCKEHSVHFVERDRESATIDGPIVEILSFLKRVDCEYLLLVNACLPFLRKETIESFLEECTSGDHEPGFAVTRRRNFFLTLAGQAVNFDFGSKTLNTKTVTPLYEFSNALYFFNREYFFQRGTYWDWSRVKLIELQDRMEILDIDTEEDFELAERLWTLQGGATDCSRNPGDGAASGDTSSTETGDTHPAHGRQRDA